MPHQIDASKFSESPPSIGDFYLLGAVFIYTPLLPVGNAETQPFMWLATIILFGSWTLLTGKAQLNTFIFFGLSLALLIFTRFWADLIQGEANIIFLIKYLFIIATLGTSYLVFKFDSNRVLNFVIYLHCTVLLISIIPGANSVFTDIMTAFFERYSGNLYSVRGLSYFSPEPSYAAICLSGVLALDQIDKATKKKNSFSFRTGVILVLLMSTKALMAAVVLMIYGISYLIGRPSILKTVGAVSFAFLIASAALSSGRVAQLVGQLDQVNWAQLDLQTTLVAVSLLEPSGSTRLITNSSAFYGGFQNGLGNGIGTYNQQWIKWSDAMGWQLLERHEVLGEAYVAGLPTTNHSVFANMTFDLGIIFIVWYILFLAYVFYNKEMKHRWTCFWYIFLLTLFLSVFQYQVTNPMLWYVLILYKNIYKGNEEHRPFQKQAVTR